MTTQNNINNNTTNSHINNALKTKTSSTLDEFINAIDTHNISNIDSFLINNNNNNNSGTGKDAFLFDDMPLEQFETFNNDNTNNNKPNNNDNTNSNEMVIDYSKISVKPSPHNKANIIKSAIVNDKTKLDMFLVSKDSNKDISRKISQDDSIHLKQNNIKQIQQTPNKGSNTNTLNTQSGSNSYVKLLSDNNNKYSNTLTNTVNTANTSYLNSFINTPKPTKKKSSDSNNTYEIKDLLCAKEKKKASPVKRWKGNLNKKRRNHSIGMDVYYSNKRSGNNFIDMLDNIKSKYKHFEEKQIEKENDLISEIQILRERINTFSVKETNYQIEIEKLKRKQLKIGSIKTQSNNNNNDNPNIQYKSHLTLCKMFNINKHLIFNNINDINDSNNTNIYDDTNEINYDFIFSQYPQLKSFITLISNRLNQERQSRLSLEEKTLQLFSNDIKAINTLEQKLKQYEKPSHKRNYSTDNAHI